MDNQNPVSGWIGNTTYNDQGYANVPAINNWGSNPYSYEQAFTQSQQGLQQGQNNMQNLQGQLTKTAGMDSGYPAMQNSFGLGVTQGQPTPGAQSNPDFLTNPINQGQPDSSSRGFNPWSMSGEALSRG